ncbi:DUF4202 domain-containing protein [Fulvivirgaceae bacterium BMA10]|uniref:DUF4202 domain-containing protein n=1 Tax=Splendidivirga corallicola TaxID=3051826 RepID=A0ABT8KU88_9BACT|nr:DUF4202 domain-containing protein [Fulvivirgaceae bacterium BMA10]
MIVDNTRLQKAIEKFDAENSKDPHKETYKGKEYPKELLYAIRMTEWLLKLDPEASEALQLAARSQHICRWTSPRESFPMDKKGYLLWRTELKKFHAEKAAGILKECDYDDETIRRVEDLILKKKIKSDPESQLLEDVVCLVFLENYFEDFSEKHEPEKVIDIIRKTWKKMSEKGHQAALNLDLPQAAHRLVEQALQA